MILNFLDKFKLSIPDEFANEKSIKSPFSLAERIENGMWEKEEIVLSKKYIKKSDNILEIGGCIGGLSVFMNSLLGKKSKHLVIEPNVKLEKTLELNRELNNASYEIKCCLIDDPETNTGEFYINDFILGSSKEMKTKELIHVPVYPLSDFSDDYNVLVIDIEGGEYDFFDSYYDEILKFDKILIEFHEFDYIKNAKIKKSQLIEKLKLSYKVKENLGNSYVFIKKSK